MLLKLPVPAFLLLVVLTTGFCESAAEMAPQDPYHNWKSLTVTATAYNSVAGQGVGNPRLTAWGDTLNPEVQSIAISRDLLQQGLKYGTPVKIKGLEGIFVVNDKMHSRWEKKIDIYMGTDQQKALEWGSKEVEICFPDY